MICVVYFLLFTEYLGGYNFLTGLQVVGISKLRWHCVDKGKEGLEGIKLGPVQLVFIVDGMV